MARRKLKIKEFNVIFQEEAQAGGYSVWVPDLPGCASQGNNFEEAKKNIVEAIELYLEDASKEEFEESDSRRQFMAPVEVRLYA